MQNYHKFLEKSRKIQKNHKKSQVAGSFSPHHTTRDTKATACPIPHWLGQESDRTPPKVQDQGNSHFTPDRGGHCISSITAHAYRNKAARVQAPQGRLVCRPFLPRRQFFCDFAVRVWNSRHPVLFLALCTIFSKGGSLLSDFVC